MPEKIIYFMDHYPKFGGAANTILWQAVLMKRAGKNVSVAVSSWWKVCEEYIRICEREGIQVYELCYCVTSQPEGVDIFGIFDHYEEIKTFLNDNLPDMVHSVQLNPVVELACRELKIPHVMDIYQVIPEFFQFKYVDIFPHYHICDSFYYADLWHKLLGTRSYCVRTVADEGKQRQYSIESDELKFVCVGLLCERKNQLEVIKAFELIVKSYGLRGRLQLWGHDETSYAEFCRQYIQERELQDYIELQGFSENMEAVYENSDVLICGSTSESYPNVVSEALAHGLVVISTPVAGVPEVIRDGENGYLSEGYEAKDLAICIQRVCKDIRAGSLQRMIEQARVTYEETHSPRAVTVDLKKCYEKILAEYQAENGYTIHDFQKEFAGITDRFYKSQDCFTNSDYVKASLWKIYYVTNFLKESGKEHICYIWGTGKYGKAYKEILDVFAPELTVAGFIDSYAKGQFLGYEIVEPEAVLGHNENRILVGVITKRSEIFAILNQNDFRYNEHYFTLEPLLW